MVQYLSAIIWSKNTKKLKNSVIIFEIILALITILFPILMLHQNTELNLKIVPLFIVLFIFFLSANNRINKWYLHVDDVPEEEKKTKKIYNRKKVKKYIIVLAAIGILLFIVGELLGDTLQKLCYLFGVPEMIVGILLGFITSIPELISFFEAQKYHKKSKEDMLGVIEATNSLLTSNMLNLFIIQTIGILIMNIKKM